MATAVDPTEVLRGRVNDVRLQDSLTAMRRLVDSIWGPGTPRVIQHFTDHGVEHCKRVAGWAVKLLEGNPRVQLTEREMYVLLAGIYLHDIGMQCDVARFPAIRYRAQDLGADFGIEFRDNAAGGYSVDEQKAIRKNHQYLSAAWISYAYNPYAQDAAMVSTAVRTIPENLVSDVMDVCMYHSKLRIADCPDTFEIYRNERKQLVAALLRLADELDIDENRVDINTVKIFSFDRGNAVYWWLHHRTTIELSEGNAITLRVVLNPTDIERHRWPIENTIIDHFVEKNGPVLAVLRRHHIPATITRDSEVLGYEFSEPLPFDIVQALQQVTPAAIPRVPELPELNRLAAGAASEDSRIAMFSAMAAETSEALMIDLGEGHNWLTSRLYVFTLLFKRMGALRCVVFVATTPAGPEQFIGIAEAHDVIDALERRYPYLSQAFAGAYTRVAEHREELLTARSPDVDAATWIVNEFVIAIQRAQESDPTNGKAVYQRLGSSWPSGTWERAEWLDADVVEGLLEGSLVRSSISKSDLQNGSPLGQKEVLAKEGNYVAVLDEHGRCSEVIDRRDLAERIAHAYFQSAQSA